MSVTTLILNADYSVLDVQSVKKAHLKLYKKKAEVLESYPKPEFETWKQAMDAPAVIRLLHFVNIPYKVNRKIPFTRKNVWLRDKGHCQYCNQPVRLSEMSWDHITPRDQGGRSNWMNLVCSCLKCNGKKDNRTPEQAGMKLIKRPVAPTYQISRSEELLMRLKSLKNFPHSKWRDYIYLNVELDES